MTKSITFADFNSPDAVKAQRLVDYYEDKQEAYAKAILDAKRKKWKERGYNVQTRNIIKSITDKSGLLFNRPPALSIVPPGQNKGVIDANFVRIMDGTDWVEVFQNVDVYTRLLKTTVVLQQKYIATDRTTVGGSYKYDESAGDALMLSILHRGNSVVRVNIVGRITELAYLTSPWSKLEAWTYRYMNGDVIEDWRVEGEEETLLNSQPNPEGRVTANAFYDVKTPRNRTDFWVNVPEDILSFQDNLNLYLSDMQFGIAHQIQKTLFTDTPITEQSDSSIVIPIAPLGQTPAAQTWDDQITVTQGNVGGLGETVLLDKGSPENPSPMVKYDGPNTDLKALYDVMASQVRDIASDWGVTIKATDSQKANSGFQVIVEEMDNLQLREQRAQSMQSGFRKFYDITQAMYPELLTGMLKVEFAEPTLPVNPLEQAQMLTYEFALNLKSPLDVFRADGMTDEDAKAKLAEILAVNKQIADAAPKQAVQLPEQQNMAQKGGNPTQPKLTP